MGYIELMNAFIVKRRGVLNAYEQAMYLSLFGIWNGLQRPEWFKASMTQLMREMGIKKKNTAVRVRNGLKEKGFIQTFSSGRGRMLQYHLNDITQDVQQTSNRELPVTKGYQLPMVTTVVTEGYHSSNRGLPIKEREKEISTTTSTAPSDSKQKSQDDGGVFQFYQDNIHPVTSGFEADRLAEDISHYGGERVIEAIKRAVLRGKRSLGYIESILNRWETDGYDEADEWKEAKANGKANGGNTQRPARRNRAKTAGDIDRERAEWFSRPHKYDSGGWATDVKY